MFKPAMWHTRQSGWRSSHSHGTSIRFYQSSLYTKVYEMGQKQRYRSNAIYFYRFTVRTVKNSVRTVKNSVRTVPSLLTHLVHHSTLTGSLPRDRYKMKALVITLAMSHCWGCTVAFQYSRFKAISRSYCRTYFRTLKTDIVFIRP